jgi:hypothetical protein
MFIAQNTNPKNATKAIGSMVAGSTIKIVMSPIAIAKTIVPKKTTASFVLKSNLFVSIFIVIGITITFKLTHLVAFLTPERATAFTTH